MKICFVVNNLNPHAGWGRLVSNVAEKMKILGHQVGFVVEKGSESQDVLVVPLKLNLSNFLVLTRSLAKVRRFVSEYDIILCYDINPYAIAISLASFGLNKKVIAYAIGTYSLLDKKLFLKNLLIRWAYNRASAIFVVSNFLRHQIEKSGYKMGDYKVIPVGVDTAFFKSETMDEEPIPFPYILGVGALKDRKGFHISIPAFSLIADDFPQLKYVIIGDKELPSYARQMQLLVRKLGIENRVIFLEKISDAELVKYYRSASLFILTPVTTPDALEGFGMVYLEAGACGRPVIGTYNSGAEAAIVNGYNGLLAQPEPVEISAVMRRLLNDGALSKTLGANGIKRSAEFDWTKVVEMYLNNFKDVFQRN